MFLEKNFDDVNYLKKASIEVICGSMFSGKTEELIRRVKRALIAKQKVLIFKPEIDKRYNKKKVVSHDENEIHSIPVKNSKEIEKYIKNVDVIAIDEAQFFDDNIINLCNKLANKGIRVIVAGLDMDFQAKPFGPMPGLLSIADYITKLHAICVRCGDIAQFSHKKIDNDTLIELGAKDIYEPLCRKCFVSCFTKN